MGNNPLPSPAQIESYRGLGMTEEDICRTLGISKEELGRAIGIGEITGETSSELFSNEVRRQAVNTIKGIMYNGESQHIMLKAAELILKYTDVTAETKYKAEKGLNEKQAVTNILIAVNDAKLKSARHG